MIDQVSGGIPFEETRNWFAARPLASCALAAALSVAAVGLRMAIAPWMKAAGFVSFLPFIVIIAYLAGAKWGYFGVALTAILVWFFVLPPGLSFAIQSHSDRLDVALFLIAAVAVIEFVRVLDRALDTLQMERRRATMLAEQRQALMKELAHRTSNNFQLVSSMLMLARRTMTAAQRALTEASERVFAMAVVQRHLSRDSGSGIELSAFLPNLCADLEKALDVHIACHGERLPPVGSQIISSLALVVQELAANAVEHGARPDACVSLTARLERRGLDRAALIVEDDGRGLPPDFDLSATKSLGLTLVRSFVQTMMGSFDIQNRPDGDGVVATVEFPLARAAPFKSPTAHADSAALAPDKTQVRAT